MRQAVAVKANIDHLLGVTDGQRKKEHRLEEIVGKLEKGDGRDVLLKVILAAAGE